MFHISLVLHCLESAQKCILLRVKGIMHVHVHAPVRIHTRVYTHAMWNTSQCKAASFFSAHATQSLSTAKQSSVIHNVKGCK